MGAINPYALKNTLTHPLARLLPIAKYQRQMYRLGESTPPSGAMAEHAPSWEVASFILDPQGVGQARINLQRDFWLIALLASASVNNLGGFRAQVYDSQKDRRFADRGPFFSLIGGNVSGPQFLREPYQFDQPDSQILLNVANLEPAQNTIQIVFYGQVLRFNQ